MLSDDALDNLMQPIIDRQEEINLYVLQLIAQRVKEVGEFRKSDLYSIQRLVQTGSDIRKINKELARLAGLQEKEIKKLLKKVALENYIDAKPLYDYRHVSFIPFEKNIILQRTVKAIEKQTLGTYRNLTDTSAVGFLIRDLKKPTQLRFQPISQAYKSVLDEAVQSSVLGNLDYGTAMRRTMQQLVNSGIRRVVYNPASGRKYTLQLDTAVRRLVLDGIRQVNQKMQDEVGKQFGADGKELDAHPYSAPDHEPFQGHQFTNEEADNMQNHKPFKDLQGRRYSALERIIGVWNCRHFFTSIIIGFSEPRYTQEELDVMIKKNHEGYTLPNGKHLTMYECTQRQRQLEDTIRKSKSGYLVARSAGDKELARKYRTKVNKKLKEYKIFSKACGLSVKTGKMSVAGYH